MAPLPGSMTFEQIRSELRAQRFGPTMDTSLNRWVNLREGIVWNDSEWPFKRVRREGHQVNAFGILQAPAAYWKTADLELSNGTVLEYLLPEDFNKMYDLDDGLGDGTPVHYTVVNNDTYFGPSAAPGMTLYLSFGKRVSHYDGASDSVFPGPMVQAIDYPVYPVEYHYMLVVGAMASGLKVQNDPTWDAIEQEFQQMLTSMREDLLPPDQYRNAQFGRDDF